MNTGLLALEASSLPSVDDRAHAKAMRVGLLLVAAGLMFSASIGLNVWLAFH
jgi:hypothetical protein